MNTYTDKLKEVEIRIKDLILTFKELTQASMDLTDDVFAEEAIVTFLKCSLMLESMILSNQGFKELFDAVIRGVEEKMKTITDTKEDSNGVAS